MNLRLRYVASLVCAVILITGSFAHAQQLSEEPAGGMDESTEDATLFFPPSKNTLPASLDFYPLNTYYSSWDTLFVRRYADAIIPVRDTIALPLFPEGTGEFIFPRKGQFLSPFGYRGRRVHAGVDIKLNHSDSISAVFDGIVRLAKYYRGYGNCVVIRHYNGLETLYGHLSKIKVKVNQEVGAGDLIGLGGRSGRASCNHLHFETRFRGQAFNPKTFINFDSFSTLSDTLFITSKTFGYSRDYLPQNLITSSDPEADIKSLTKSKPAAGVKTFHTIKRGDTLYAVARKHGTTVKQLCKLNGIKETKVLQVGTRLRVR